MSPPEGTAEDRRQGRARNGEVFLRDFDLGMVTQLGAVLGESSSADPAYLVTVEGVAPPPGFAGIPVYAANPEDAFQRYVQPFFLFRRDSHAPAMNRWHPGAQQYNIFDSTSAAASAVLKNGAVRAGFRRRVGKGQALPMDLSYTLLVSEVRRTGAQAMFRHALRRFHPHGFITVTDSVGDARTYDAYLESMDAADDIFDVSDRTVAFNLSIRVEGELDVGEEVSAPTVHAGLTRRIVTR